MQNSPEIIKLLAEKTKNSPEWTGTNGVFVSPFSGYMGVKLFAEYMRHLKLSNANKIPESLPHLNRDYVDFLEEKSETEKEEFSSYYKHTLPRLYEMIRTAKMTKESILEFANIFNSLGIGFNPVTTISDYQEAISESFKTKKTNVKENTESDKEQTGEAYTQLVLSDKERQDIEEKCRQKGVMVSNSDLDDLYVGSGGCIYHGNGTSVTNVALGNAVSETLQYEVANGSAERLIFTKDEIAEILAECKRKGVDISKEDLENMYVDKDGYIYFGDSTAVTSIALGNAVNQTRTYANSYGKIAPKRQKLQVVPEPDQIPTETAQGEGLEPTIPEKLPEPPLEGAEAIKTIKTGDATPKEEAEKGKAKKEKSIYVMLPNGEKLEISKEGYASAVFNGDNALPEIRPQARPLWLRTPKKKHSTRKMVKNTETKGNYTQNLPGKTQGGEAQNGQRFERIPASQGIPYLPARKKSVAGFAGKVFGGIGGGYVGAKVTGIAATFFIPTNVIDSHYFISSILKIILS